MDEKKSIWDRFELKRGEALVLPEGYTVSQFKPYGDAEAIDVPFFARLSDYLGCWSMDPMHFSGLVRSLRSFDLKAHVEHGAEPLKSAMAFEALPNGKQIAILPLNGILMKGNSSLGGTSTVLARRDLRQATANPDVAGIMIIGDSPGGTVAGTYDLAMEVRASAQKKPVHVHIQDLGASAFYWIASQANRITVNAPTALVGSIGTIQVLQDLSAAAEMEGVRTIVIATGALKGLGTPGTKITDSQINHVQALVSGAQESFDEAVKRGRGMDSEALASVRHGGVLLASEAVKAGLVDAVQPLGKAMRDLQTATTEGTPARRAAILLPLPRRASLLTKPRVVAFQDQWDGTKKQA